jgi:membrane fusion protein (multidrug efflux system)
MFGPYVRHLPLLIGVLFLPCLSIGCRKTLPPTEEGTPQAPVKAEAAKTLVLGEWTDLLGTTQPLPNHSARVSAAVEGRVLSVLGDSMGAVVTEGQQVKAGQVIVRLDDRVLQANREKLRAALDDLDEQKKQAGYAVELAKIEVNRLEELTPSSSSSGSLPLVSRVELNRARIAQKDAESKQKSVTAKHAVATAELKALDEQLHFYTLRAPIAGRLGIVQAVPGQTLSAGTVVAEVVDLNEIDVVCYAPPDAAARLALDQPAKLVLGEAAGEDGKRFPAGKVAFVGIQAQPETGNVAVKVRFPNPDLRLRTNTVVRVHVLTKPEKERLTIPETALMEDRDPPTVVAVQDVKSEKKNGDEQKVGKVRKLQATLGVRDRDRHVVELLGLVDPATKETVAPQRLLFVTAGGNGLQNDDVVKLQKEESKEEK